MSKPNTIEGYQCSRCNFKFKFDDAKEIQTFPPSWDSSGGSPAEYEDLCPNCGRVLDDYDAADLEVDEAGVIL
jgi:transcription initiation factor IIE alpha subunit